MINIPGGLIRTRFYHIVHSLVRTHISFHSKCFNASKIHLTLTAGSYPMVSKSRDSLSYH